MWNTWHTKTKKEVLSRLYSSGKGLTQKKARRRLKEDGPNVIPEGKRDPYWKIFLRQFRSPLIYILLAATVIVLLMGETTDGMIILLVMLFNAVVGTIQEGRAQNTLLALKRGVETKALIIRDGKKVVVRDKEIVPGDIIIFHEGDKVPADARLLEANHLLVNESMLTGESQAVLKETRILRKAKIPIQKQSNMVFRGTNVVGGSGLAVAVATGLDTEIGRISAQISRIDTEIPLHRELKDLSRLIIFIVAVAVTGLFFLGIAHNQSLDELFTTAVALAVSVVPEGLPIVLTLILASGVWRMGKRNALVKKLHAVEALGQAEFIAVDKTGTITENELVVTNVFAGGKLYQVRGSGYNPEGEIAYQGKKISLEENSVLFQMARSASLVSEAQIYFSEEEGFWKSQGDPTEAALSAFSEKSGVEKSVLEKEWSRIQNIPFDYQKKYHAALFHSREKNLLAVIGAPEKILRLSNKYYESGTVKPLTKEKEKEFHEVFLKMGRKGLRVLAVAQKENHIGKIENEKLPQLVFLGFVGMKDSLKPRVREVIQEARKAGMQIAMITGDHRNTALSVAKEAGIYRRGSKVITGEELDEMSEEEIKKSIFKTTVFARLTPDHKLKIIQACRSLGKIIAMTGDGVNDALPLVAADLGIAMGKKGTEVAKEASDIVLLDDNFQSIIAAVEEGRAIYLKIKKVVLYLLSTGLGEVLSIMGAMGMGFPALVLPSQIIWLNFVTDGFLDMALAMEPNNPQIGKGKFKRPGKYFFDALMFERLIVMGFVMAIGTLFLFLQYIEFGPRKAMTVALTTLAVFQWFNAWNCRSKKRSVFKMNPFSNKYLVGATLLVIGLQFAAVYNPFFQRILHTVPLSAMDWVVMIAIGTSILVVEEIRKIFYKRKKRPKKSAK